MEVRIIVVAALLLGCHTDRLVGVPECEKLPEICNGLDDDCNGAVDDVVIAVLPGEVFFTEPLSMQCQNQCGLGKQYCLSGSWTECDARQPSSEVCDGKDNDCNGFADDGLQIEPCYPGNQNDLLYGKCRFGVKKCTNGVQHCINWVGPSQEVCNGLDDDCDGKTDEGDRKDVDIVFALDYSGSMMYNIPLLAEWLSLWANAQNTPEVRYALVGIPSPDRPEDVTLMYDLTDNVTFAGVINSFTKAYGHGREAQLDAIHMVSDPANPLRISWRSPALKMLVVFTDEEPQSYFTPEIDEFSAWFYADTNNVKTYIFTNEIMWDINLWDITSLDVGQNMNDKLNNIMSVVACE